MLTSQGIWQNQLLLNRYMGESLFTVRLFFEIMEILKHECGVAMIRLLKPLDYYKQKYGTRLYGLNKLYLMMEKQHNRGQEGAGMACVKLDVEPGNERKDAITHIF